MENKKSVLSEENVNPKNSVTEGEISDEKADAVSGGVQAGDIFKPVYDEIPKPVKLNYL